MDLESGLAESHSRNGGDKDSLLHEGKLLIDVARNRFPYCIVWSPIPVLTWVLPFVGHMGIASSQGVMYDFAGPYSIGVDGLAFGNPTRYIQLDPREVMGEPWDVALRQGCDVYSRRMHILCWDNCHSHVGHCLSSMKYANSTNWNMVKLAFWMFFVGKYTGVGGFLKTWLPFALLVIGIGCLSLLF